MHDRNTRDSERGQGKVRAPEDHRHKAQGTEGGKGEKQGIWAAPAKGGGREGPDHACSRPQGQPHLGHTQDMEEAREAKPWARGESMGEDRGGVSQAMATELTARTGETGAGEGTRGVG